MRQFFMLVASACAYSDGSHRAVAFAASQMLTSEANEFVKAALELRDVAEVPEAMMDVSGWADTADVRDSVVGSSDWHFYNAPADFVNYAAAPCGPSECLVTALSEQIQLTLSTDPTVSISQALKFVIHFVADLHQPLHVGRGSDDGGTAIKVSIPEPLTKRLHKAGRVSLHTVWDLALPEYASLVDREELNPGVPPAGVHIRAATKEQLYPRLSPAEIGADFHARAVAAVVAKDTLPEITPATIGQTDVLEQTFGRIATEVHKIGLLTAYSPFIAGGDKNAKLGLDKAYFEANIPVVQSLLQTASIRLAQVLNAIAAARVPPTTEAPASAAAHVAPTTAATAAAVDPLSYDLFQLAF